MDKKFPIWDNLVFYQNFHNIRTIIWKFQMFDETWLKIGCLVKVVACLLHKSSTYIAAMRGYKYIPILPILVAYESWYSTYLFILKVSKLPEFQCCCWPEFMGVENICPLWGEERRERSMWMSIELGDLHPHPPKKLLHVLVVIATHSRASMGKKGGGWKGKKEQIPTTHAKVSNLLCVWYGWY